MLTTLTADFGFDNRFIGTSHGLYFGFGFYFADQVSVSMKYASGAKLMFVCKVLLGKSERLTTAPTGVRYAPSQGYHSTIGDDPKKSRDKEYIVSNHDQALPLFLIKYQ